MKMENEYLIDISEIKDNHGGLAPTVFVPPGVVADIKSTVTDPNVIIRNSSLHSVQGRVFKAESCSIAPYGSVVMQELDTDWIAIVIRKLNIEGKTTFMRTDRYDAGLNGDKGADGIRGDNGKGQGGSGRHGANGEDGHDGLSRSVPTTYIFIEEFFVDGLPATTTQARDLLKFFFTGYKGGDGGAGGKGGDGGNGMKGEAAVGGYLWCVSGVGFGGFGGDAGAGGVGGRPGNGGDAKTSFLLAPPPTLSVLKSAVFDLSGGLPGNQGRDGHPGIPGKGGPAGEPSSDGSCAPDPGRKGHDGAIRPPCFKADYERRTGASAVIIAHPYSEQEFDELFI